MDVGERVFVRTRADSWRLATVKAGASSAGEVTCTVDEGESGTKVRRRRHRRQ